MKNYLCVDIGGTACKVGILNEKGEIIIKSEERVDFDNYQTPIIETVVKTMKKLLKDHKLELSGIAVSAAGQIDSYQGKVIGTCGNLPNYIGSDFKTRFETEFNLYTTVVNDANCMILGEKWLGSCINDKNAVGITIGTGIGGGVIVDNKILLGNNGIAGELGHIILEASATKNEGLNSGRYEPYAATSYLVKKINQELKVNYDGRAIFKELEKQNPIIKKYVDEWIEYIALGLVSFVHIFNPSVILIGGGVSSQEELLIKPLRNKVFEKIMPAFKEGLRIEAAKLKNDAGMVGALYYHLNHK